MALILVIIAFIAFATYGMLDGSKDEEWYPVSVIVENSSIDSFQCFADSHNIILWWLRLWSSVRNIWHYGILSFGYACNNRYTGNLQGL